MTDETEFLRAFVRQVDLAELRVLDVQASVLGQTPEKGQLEISSAIGLEDRPPSSFVVVASINVSGTSFGTEPPYMKMHLRVLARYDLKEGVSLPDNSQLLSFAQRVAITNLWPYARVLAHSVSLQLALPPVILPIIFPDNHFAGSVVTGLPPG